MQPGKAIRTRVRFPPPPPILALLIALCAFGACAADVVTLADSGPGSLRAAVARPGTVRFRPAGVAAGSTCAIDLESPLEIRAKDVVIDGLSAPCRVTLRWSRPRDRAAIDVYETARVTIRGITCDARADYPNAGNHDCIRVWNSTDVTLSRNTLLHAVDEAIEIHGSQRVTVSENWLKDPIQRKDGSRGYCLLVYGAGNDQILIWRNVFEGCAARSPMIAAGKRIAVANNLIRGTKGWQSYVYAFDYPPGAPPLTQVDYEANLFEPAGGRKPWLHVGGVASQPSPGTLSLYLRGNLDGAHRSSNAEDEWRGVEIHQGAVQRRSERAWEHGAKIVPAAELRGMKVGAP